MKGGSLIKNFTNPVSSLKYCTAKKVKTAPKNLPRRNF